MHKTFYYRFNRINLWMALNAALVITLVWCLSRCPCLLYWRQTQVLIGVASFSILAWGYKYILKHKMAVVTDDDITIDHCAPLKWKDVAAAEERLVRCGLRKYKVIALIPKDGIDYKYNFLQKHNGGFTAFSIPLYGIISNSDADEISGIVKDKVPFSKLP